MLGGHRNRSSNRIGKAAVLKHLKGRKRAVERANGGVLIFTHLKCGYDADECTSAEDTPIYYLRSTKVTLLCASWEWSKPSRPLMQSLSLATHNQGHMRKGRVPYLAGEHGFCN